MVSRVLFADTRARYGFDCSKTEPSPVPACRLIRCAAPTPAGAVAAVRRRWRSAGPARSPSWSVGPVSKAPLRRELRRFRWRALAARLAAAARSQLEAREIRRARGGKFDYRKLLGGERARREPEQAQHQRRDRQRPPHSCRQLVRTVILATWGDVAVARTRGLGATPGAASSGTTRTSRGTLAPGAAAATARFSGSGTVNVVGPCT